MLLLLLLDVVPSRHDSVQDAAHGGPLTSVVLRSINMSIVIAIATGAATARDERWHVSDGIGQSRRGVSQELRGKVVKRVGRIVGSQLTCGVNVGQPVIPYGQSGRNSCRRRCRSTTTATERGK